MPIKKPLTILYRKENDGLYRTYLRSIRFYNPYSLFLNESPKSSMIRYFIVSVFQRDALWLHIPYRDEWR